MEKKLCRLQEPYPEITCNGKNPNDVRLLCLLYSGTASELSAILQYSYQHMVLECKCNDVSDTIMDIAIVEMMHLELLGDAICKLGGNPRYVNNNINNWWNASAVCYDDTLCKAIKRNIEDEHAAHKAYLETAEKVSNPSVCALLKRIAKDEKLHLEIFKAIYDTHCKCR